MRPNSSQLDFVTVDVFTETRYEGNPLAIVTIPESASLSQDQKQAIAREFNLSETTFLHQHSRSELAWTVDIFLTTAELPFAGHPIIGTACHILSRAAQAQNKSDGEVEGEFNLKAGTVKLRYDVGKKIAKADIPHDFNIHKTKFLREELLKMQPRLAESSARGEVHLKEHYPVVSVVKGLSFVLVELENEAALSLVSTTSGEVPTQLLDEGWPSKFIGTYFFVRSLDRDDGINLLRTRMVEKTLEDPATGSAASALAGYLSLVEGRPGQILQYAITQGVEMGRRSHINVEVMMAESNGVEKVSLQGSVVQVMEGRVTA